MSSARFESDPEEDTHTAAFAERVRANQQGLTAELKPHYDFIVCGSGSSGSVVARGLAENAEVSVLLLEAGGSDDMPSIMEAGQWPLNIGSERDWAFMGQSNPHLNGRSIPLNMGKVGVPAGRSAMAPRPTAWWDELRIQQIAGAGTAFLFAGSLRL
jgi:choline dehydrogenase